MSREWLQQTFWIIFVLVVVLVVIVVGVGGVGVVAAAVTATGTAKRAREKKAWRYGCRWSAGLANCAPLNIRISLVFRVILAKNSSSDQPQIKHTLADEEVGRVVTMQDSSHVEFFRDPYKELRD